MRFIVNERAGSALRLGSLREEAKRRFPSAPWMTTKAPGDATALASAAANDREDVVVAVGGDGTINEVVNGLLAAGCLHVPTLGIVPAGSGSDFIKTLGVPRNAVTALRVVADNHSTLIDVGEICCAPLAPSSTDETTTRFFVNMAGCGASGRVVERFNQRMFPGTFGYAVACATTAVDYAFPRVSMTFDDSSSLTVVLNVLFVCNGEYCGGGMHVGKGAKLDDGLLQVVSVGDVSRVGSMLQWPRLYTGRVERVRGAHVQAARTLRVTSEEDVLVDCDGELCGRLPATYTVRERALRVICPA